MFWSFEGILPGVKAEWLKKPKSKTKQQQQQQKTIEKKKMYYVKLEKNSLIVRSVKLVTNKHNVASKGCWRWN